MAENDVPFDNDDDDLEIQMGGAAGDGKTAEQVKEEVKIRPVPRGRHDFLIHLVKLTTKDAETNQPQEKPWEVWVQDDEGHYTIQESYEAHEVEVTYSLVAEPEITIRQKFRMPPNDLDQMDLYLNGCTAYDDTPIDRRKGGESKLFSALKVFLRGIGMKLPNDGGIPSGPLKDWKYWPNGDQRDITLEIQDQQTLNRETGKWEPRLIPGTKDAWPSIRAFSHDMTTKTQQRLGVLPPSHQAPSNPKPASLGGKAASPAGPGKSASTPTPKATPAKTVTPSAATKATPPGPSKKPPLSGF